jgi:hypothetical protein
MTEDNPGAAFETFSGGTTVNSEAVPDRPSASLADLEALLSEFDAATKPAEQPQATQPESAPKPETSDKIADDPVLSAIIKSREAMTEEARRHLSSYGARVDALFNDRIREFAQRDFDNIVAKGEKMLNPTFTSARTMCAAGSQRSPCQIPNSGRRSIIGIEPRRTSERLSGWCGRQWKVYERPLVMNLTKMPLAQNLPWPRI